MRKITIIGAGNVGSQAALFFLREGLSNILLIDTVRGLAKGKAFDLQDCAGVLKLDSHIEGTEDFSRLEDSSVVVITAGLARRPGMSREDLLKINADILIDVSLKIKNYCPEAIVVVVTNPLDLMVHLVSHTTGFDKGRVLGMGAGLDAARFANLVHEELKVPVSVVEASVVGSHGQAMVPVSSLTLVSGARVERLISPEIARRICKHTVERGASIVSHLGAGSSFFAPAAAITEIVRALMNDEKKVIGVCAYLNGQYGIKDLYLGVPARIGKNGVEEIIELELSAQERESLLNSARDIRRQVEILTPKH